MSRIKQEPWRTSPGNRPRERAMASNRSRTALRPATSRPCRSARSRIGALFRNGSSLGECGEIDMKQHLVERSARIFVAGHRGLVGSAIMRQLAAEGYTNLLTATREQLDLRDQA